MHNHTPSSHKNDYNLGLQGLLSTSLKEGADSREVLATQHQGPGNVREEPIKVKRTCKVDWTSEDNYLRRIRIGKSLSPSS